MLSELCLVVVYALHSVRYILYITLCTLYTALHTSHIVLLHFIHCTSRLTYYAFTPYTLAGEAVVAGEAATLGVGLDGCSKKIKDWLARRYDRSGMRRSATSHMSGLCLRCRIVCEWRG